MELSERQREILRHVVDEYVATGQPVGSKTLVDRSDLGVSSSTVRNELADLETLGLLTHPHTSAGRVPTEQGYRFYAADLLERLEPRPARFPIDLSASTEVHGALEATTEALSHVTRLLALVSAPPIETSTVRHVEVLLLQPQVVLAVVITSTGSVTKRVVAFDNAVDPGLVEWAGAYLNDRVAGLRIGTHQLRQRFEDPDLTQRERDFLDALRPAFTEVFRAEQRLYVGGTATLLDDVRAEEIAAYRRLLEVLEQRAALLQIIGGAAHPLRPFVRVGGDLDDPGLNGVALVGASYGVRHRSLGAVTLLGPVRMDYAKAISSVRGAAQELSRFVEEVYTDS